MINNFVEAINDTIEAYKSQNAMDLYFLIGNVAEKTLRQKKGNKWIEVQEPNDFPAIVLDTSNLQFNYRNQNHTRLTTYSASISIIQIKRTNFQLSETEDITNVLFQILNNLNNVNIRFLNNEYDGIFFDDPNYFGVAVNGNFLVPNSFFPKS